MSEEQKKKLSQAHKGRVFSEEHKRNLSKAHKGQIPSNLKQLRAYRKGRPLTDEHKRKIGEAQKGKSKNYSKEALRKMREASLGRPAWNKGKGSITKNCLKCKEKFTSKKFAGRKFCSQKCCKSFNVKENHYKFIEDRTLLKRDDRRNDSLYKDWRIRVYKRDGYDCVIKDEHCFGRLEAHHIKSWAKYPKLRYEISNGITLCKYHHPRTRKEEKEQAKFLKSLIN